MKGEKKSVFSRLRGLEYQDQEEVCECLYFIIRNISKVGGANDSQSCGSQS